MQEVANPITHITIGKIIILFLSIFLFTFLRSYFIPFYVVLPLLFWIILPYIPSLSQLFLLIIFLVALLVVYFTSNTFYSTNLVVSAFLKLTIIFILLTIPLKFVSFPYRKTLFLFFIKIGTFLLILNNCIGIGQYILNPQDDSFLGIYGTHGIAMHGLAILNATFLFYNFHRFRYSKERRHLILAAIFGISFLFCFYGLALIFLILSFALFFIKRQMILGIVKFFIYTIVLLLAIHFISPDTSNYNFQNAKKTITGLTNASRFDDPETPRKIILFQRYYKLYSNDPIKFAFGTGPGTFNSRTSFLLNGDYSKNNPLENLFGVSRPKEATKYIYPLWDSRVLAIPYQDGTRNQPFSTIVAFLSEYGFIFTFFLFLFVANRFFLISKNLKKNGDKHSMSLHGFFFQTCAFYFFLLLTDNLIEFTEIIIFLLIFKFIELISIFKAENSVNENTADS